MIIKKAPIEYEITAGLVKKYYLAINEKKIRITKKNILEEKTIVIDRSSFEEIINLYNQKKYEADITTIELE